MCIYVKNVNGYLKNTYSFLIQRVLAQCPAPPPAALRVEPPPPAYGAPVCLEGDHHGTEGAAPLLTATAGDLRPCLLATHSPPHPPGPKSGVITGGGGGVSIPDPWGWDAALGGRHQR